MIDRFERFSHTVCEITKYWNKLATIEMEKYGLKGSSVVYLTTLYHHSEGVTSATLTELSGRDKADVSRVIAAMEKKGLVEREAVNNNLYRALVKLTPKGVAVAEEAMKRASLAVEIVGGGIPEDKLNVFYECLDRIEKNLEAVSLTGLPKCK